METIQLGGDTPEKALEKLNPLVEESHQSTVLPVVISDRTEEVPISKLGITSSAETALKTAMSVGRTGGVEDRKNQIQTARQSGVKCDLKYEYDEASIRAAVKEYCASISPEPTKEEVTFDPSLPERFIFSEDVYKRQGPTQKNKYMEDPEIAALIAEIEEEYKDNEIGRAHV